MIILNTHKHTHIQTTNTHTHKQQTQEKQKKLYADNAEFDELIAALKTGAYFEAYARWRGRCGSGVVASPRNSRLLEFSREQLPSAPSSLSPFMNPTNLCDSLTLSRDVLLIFILV